VTTNRAVLRPLAQGNDFFYPLTHFFSSFSFLVVVVVVIVVVGINLTKPTLPDHLPGFILDVALYRKLRRPGMPGPAGKRTWTRHRVQDVDF